MGVVVTKESNKASYFTEAGNLIGSNADMCSDVTGLKPPGSFDFGSSSRSRTFTIFHLTCTAGRQLAMFETSRGLGTNMFLLGTNIQY